jgi:hydrogenase maturation protease
MSDRRGPILVLGIGNVLLGDEGVGVHLVRALEAAVARGEVRLPPATEPVDAGTLGLRLLAPIAEARTVLIVDAADLGLAPGSARVIRGAALGRPPAPGLATHRAGVADLLTAARLDGSLPNVVSLVAIQPGEVEVGLDLTDAVRSALPAALATIVDELWHLHVVASHALDPIATHQLAGGTA